MRLWGYLIFSFGYLFCSSWITPWLEWKIFSAIQETWRSVISTYKISSPRIGLRLNEVLTNSTTGLNRSIINTSGRVWSESMPLTNPKFWRLTQNWLCAMLWILCGAMQLLPIWLAATLNRWPSSSVIIPQTIWTAGNDLTVGKKNDN
jgi:hypothetical protein